MIEIFTPLGRLLIACSSTTEEEISFSVKNGSKFRCEPCAVEGEDVDVVFEIQDFETSVPEGYPPLLGSLTVSARVRRQSQIEITFSEDFANYTGGGDPGEWLEAVTYENGEYSISIGTWDDELSLSGKQSEIPARLTTVSPKPLIVSSKNDGLVVAVPQLLENETYSFPFQIAWSAFDAEKSSTWFAVGM